MRSLNFFSPMRKALRDSAYKQKMEKFRQQRLQKQARVRGSITIPSDLSTKFTNEEVLRKNPRVRRMVTRPTAVLPRRHLLFLKNGTVPLSLEDLSVPATGSVFDESKMPNLKELFSGKVKKNDDSWLFKKSPKKGLPPVEWKKKPVESSTAKLSSILDIDSSTVKSKSNPDLLVDKIVLGPTTLAAMPQIPQDKSLTGNAENLISILREKAVAYSSTGINPDLMRQMERAIGIERKHRNEELKKCEWTIASLISCGRASTQNFNLLIRALGFQSKTSDAFDVHDTMVRLGFETDQDTYVSLIMAARSDASLARKAYLKMREMLIPPNEKVYGALIKAHVRGRDLTSAFALLAKYENEESIKPTSSPVVIYTTLLDGLVKAGKTELAFERFRNWRTWKNLKPDAVMFSVLIKACIPKQECEKALGFLDDLRVSGEYPTDLTYTHLIDCLSRREDFAEKAFEFHHQMQLEGFDMNRIIAESLIRACASLGDVNRLKKTIKEIANHGMKMTPCMYADSIRTLSRGMKTATDFEKNVNLRLAWYILNDLRSKSVPVSAKILNAVMAVYSASGSVEQTVLVLEQFEKFDCAPNEASYEILLEMFAQKKDIGRFFALFDHVPGKISDQMFHFALDMAIESRSSKRTVLVLERMLERGLRPLPAAAEKLAVAGRKIVQIHQVIGKMVAQQRDETHARTEKENALIALDIEEHKTRIALVEGKTETEYVTPENEAKDMYWSKKKRRGGPKLAISDFREIKKKGGKMHALRVDKPRPNLLVSYDPFLCLHIFFYQAIYK